MVDERSSVVDWLIKLSDRNLGPTAGSAFCFSQPCLPSCLVQFRNVPFNFAIVCLSCTVQNTRILDRLGRTWRLFGCDWIFFKYRHATCRFCWNRASNAVCPDLGPANG